MKSCNVTISNNRILDNPDLKLLLKEIPDNTIVELSFEIKGKKRKNAQNAFYWKLIECISEEIGESKNNVHDLMVYKFLGSNQFTVMNTVITKLPSTTSLSTKEFTKYIQEIEKWAVEFLQIKIPSE